MALADVEVGDDAGEQGERSRNDDQGKEAEVAGDNGSNGAANGKEETGSGILPHGF